MKVLEYPNPILTTPCEPIEVGSDITELYNQLLSVLEADSNAAGVAAPQIGVNKAMFLLRTENSKEIHCFINPVSPAIGGHGKKVGNFIEACLSFPGKVAFVQRYRSFTVKFFDENWKPLTRSFLDYDAHVVQHELDHLNGITIAQSSVDGVLYDWDELEKNLEFVDSPQSNKAKQALDNPEQLV